MARFAARRAAPVLAAPVLALLAARPVAAHEAEVIRYGSFLGGLTHPVLGPDHLLAMLSVGILSTQIGGRAILTVPAAFVACMAIGGAVGVASGFVPMPFVEAGIAGSVLLLGFAIALARRIPIAAVMAAVGFFGSLHGYAHGVEIPEIATPLLYAFGFLSGTAGIHLLGVLIGEVARQYRAGLNVLRGLGAAVGVVGGLFLAGII